MMIYLRKLVASWPWLLLTPVVLPVAWVLYETWAGPESLGDVLTSARQRTLLGHSLRLAGGTALAALVLGLPTGIILARVRIPFGRTLIALFAVPLAVPPYVLTTAWIQLLGRQGTLASALGDIPGAPATRFDVYGMPGAILILAGTWFPLVLFAAWAAARSIDRRQEEAARLFTGWRRTFWHVTLPQTFGPAMAATLLVFLLALGEFGVPSLLGIPTYALEVFTQFSAFYQPAAALGAALPLLVIAFIALALVLRPAWWRAMGVGEPPAAFPIGRWRWIPFAFLVLLAFAAVVLPLAALAVRVGGPMTYLTALEATLPNWTTTLLIAAGSATVVTLCGFITGYCAARAPHWQRFLWHTLALIGFVVPGAVVGIGLVYLCNRDLFGGIYGSGWMLLLACYARFFAVAQAGLGAAIKRVDVRHEEAAIVCGVPHWRIRLGIVAPQIARPLAAVWVAVFVLSAGELAAAVLVYPPGWTPLSVRMFSLMHYGIDPVVCALCLWSAALAAAPVLLLLWLGARETKEPSDA